MDRNKETIEQFYSAFARLDADAMGQCYSHDVKFQDEVFTLNGRREAAGMWRMLCDAVKSRGRDDWKLEWRDVKAYGPSGSAHWDAHYRFSATGRMVHNSIDAQFDFTPDGLIRKHRDSFDFWLWSRQALGLPGTVLGWTPLLRRKVQKQAGANLRAYLARDGA